VERHRRLRSAARELKATASQEKNKDMVIFAHDYIGHQISLHGLYEKRLISLIIEFLDRLDSKINKSTAIDVGANIGNHSLALSEYFKSVLSFEPEPENFELLKINTRLENNIEIFNLALSDESGLGHVVSGHALNRGTAHIASSAKTEKNSSPCTLEKLDSIKDIEGPVGFIKIDVEGHEFKVLQGGAKLIKMYQPIIALEQHPSDFRNGTSDSIEWLRDNGYQSFLIWKELGKFFGIPVKPFGFMARLIPSFCSVEESLQPVSQVEPGFYNLILAIPKRYAG
jgi:FkbM family methyltransferase